MKYPKKSSIYRRLALLLLSGLVLFAFLGLSLHVVFDAAHHHLHHAGHDHHGGHGGGGGHGEHAPHDCTYCVLLGTFVFLLLGFPVVPVLLHAVRLLVSVPPPPRVWDAACAHPLRGPPRLLLT